ncbi:hypothetical protein K461DRAFT_272678 [Myriangium duriaei CBS 260.36]|uniref:C2H2-type domain-containing protein n=1 Tax=Myriangium duriaei CBS 260.36 TaxID=1168546 RepID=A0A9P4JD20_9PEZI|nr:hypothetical protein K461DRAFT_272678 [Myriangium duriaei CBS 260.36]
MSSLKIKCTYDRCDQWFENEKEMKRHKKFDPQHHYCSKCDYDAVDWDDLLQHKVEVMAETIYNHRPGEKMHLKHLVCEFCGTDFKNLDARMNHRRYDHQGDQQILCAGNGPVIDAGTGEWIHDYCNQFFFRASDLVHHYERGYCQFVDASTFQKERQHKHVLKQILKNPELFCTNMSASKAIKDGDTISSAADTEDTMSSISGGVALLDLDDTSEASLVPSLLPQADTVNVMDQVIDDRLSVPHHPRAVAWPSSLSHSEAEYIRRVASRVVSTAAGASSPPSASEVPSLSSASSASSSADSSSTIRAGSYSRSVPRSSSLVAPRNTTSTLSAYMAGLKDSDPLAIDWDALSRLVAPNTPPETRTNLFNTHWYDPHSDDYTVELFFHPLLEAYKCPFANCDAEYDTQLEIEQHLLRSHVLVSNVCPLCNKAFDRVFKLVQHFEASVRGSNCRVCRTTDFARLVADVTGGFVDVEQGWRKEERVAGVRRDAQGRLTIARVGDTGGDGVRTVRFVGALPGRWADMEQQNAVEGTDERSLTENGQTEDSDEQHSIASEPYRW